METLLEKLVFEKILDKLEQQYLKNRYSEFFQITKHSKMYVPISWEEDKSKMSFEFLRSKTVVRVVNNLPEDFEVVWLDLEKVVKSHATNPDKIFPLDNLWSVREPLRTTALIDFCLIGSKLIPPIIRVLKNKSVVIIDGHYRIGLCRYLGLSSIPFLIRRDYLTNTEYLK